MGALGHGAAGSIGSVGSNCSNATISPWGRGNKKSTRYDNEEEKKKSTFAFFSLCSDTAAIAAGREVEVPTSGEME